jgi:hypothetical protein
MSTWEITVTAENLIASNTEYPVMSKNRPILDTLNALSSATLQHTSCHRAANAVTFGVFMQQTRIRLLTFCNKLRGFSQQTGRKPGLLLINSIQIGKENFLVFFFFNPIFNGHSVL